MSGIESRIENSILCARQAMSVSQISFSYLRRRTLTSWKYTDILDVPSPATLVVKVMIEIGIEIRLMFESIP